MSQFGWVPYSTMSPPTSPGRITLAEFLEAYVDAWGVDDFDPIPEMFDAADHRGKSLRSVAHFLGEAIQSGKVPSFARPIGGGPVQAIAPSLWELDDFTARFRSSAFDPFAAFDPAAVPTHLIFVDEASVKAFIDDWLAKGPLDADIVRQAGISPQPHAQVGSESGLLRLPEVMKKTGLKRSTIYAMIQRGEFPGPVKLGERSSAWPIGVVEEWISSRAPKP